MYPVTIVKARYGGSYEPGAWLAFHEDSEALPPGWDGDDTTCSTFWRLAENLKLPIGAGSSPQAAYEDLVTKVEP